MIVETEMRIINVNLERLRSPVFFFFLFVRVCDTESGFS